MPRRRHAVLAAALLLLAASSRAAPATIHLDRERGSGYQRPRLADAACLPAALSGQPAAAGLDARVAFTVERDGSLTDLRVDPPAAPEVEAALRQAFQSCRWVEGRDPDGRPVVVRVTQPVLVRGAAAAAVRPRTVDRAEAPGLPPPPVALGGGSLRLDGEHAAGFRRPELDDPACLPAALQRQQAAAGVANKAKFAVMRDGTVSHFTLLEPVARQVERAVEAAFLSCTWRPALDPEGEPLAVWVVQPIKVAPPPPPPEVQRPLFP
jgi:hypothetical protein